MSSTQYRLPLDTWNDVTCVKSATLESTRVDILKEDSSPRSTPTLFSEYSQRAASELQKYATDPTTSVDDASLYIDDTNGYAEDVIKKSRSDNKSALLLSIGRHGRALKTLTDVAHKAHNLSLDNVKSLAMFATNELTSTASDFALDVLASEEAKAGEIFRADVHPKLESLCASSDQFTRGNKIDAPSPASGRSYVYLGAEARKRLSELSVSATEALTRVQAACGADLQLAISQQKSLVSGIDKLTEGISKLRNEDHREASTIKPITDDTM